MKYGPLIILFVFLFLVVGGVLIYFVFEKPKQDNVIEFVDFNIYAYDAETDKEVVTGFILKMKNMSGIYKNGETIKGGGKVVDVPINKTVRVYNKNKEDQEYYIFSKTVDTRNSSVNDSFRVNLKLNEPGSLDVSHEFKNENIIDFTLDTDGIIKNVAFCLDWSKNIIKVELPDQDFSEIEPPRRLDTFYRCYDTGMTINESYTIKLKYKKFGNINSGDYIETVIFDGDYSPLHNRIIYETDKKEDIAKKDMFYTIDFEK